jgi:serine/threonine protein kinase/tetratricopeptide (TPR) repeat protein
MVLAVGDRLGRYEIRGSVGAGGMGEIYRAVDATLEREVAVKVLPDEFVRDPMRRARFEREAKAVARLSHPNILAIHDFGREGDVVFAVTELLDGETMRDRIGRAPIHWREAVEMGACVADGLAVAHREGIVHRDLKPANLFVTTEGHVKILDFGLARLHADGAAEGTARQGDDTCTQEGTVLGTVGYMSPEQLRGESVGPAADIFSFGCVLYELLTGRRAFQRDSAVETMAAILHEPPPSIDTAEIPVGPELAATIERCLEKRPEARFQSAADLAFALRELISESDTSRPASMVLRSGRRPIWTWRVASAVALMVIVGGVFLWNQRNRESPTDAVMDSELEINRVMVLPFENRSGDSTLDPLCQLVSDTIEGMLGQVSSVDVAVRPAAFSPAVQDPVGGVPRERFSDIAKSARSAYVVTGALHFKGDDIEIHARIVDPRKGEIAQSFEPERAPRTDPGRAVETVSQRVAGSLAAHFNHVTPLGVARPVRFDAFQEYLAAWRAWGINPRATFAHLETASNRDPGFVLPKAMIFWLQIRSGQFAAAEGQLELLEGQLPGMTPFEKTAVRAARARLEGRRLDLVAATREAVQIAPQAYWLRFDLGNWLITVNRPAEAAEVLGSLPFDWTTGSDVFASLPFVRQCVALHMAGSYEDELRVASESLSHFPDVVWFVGQQGDALAALGRFDDIDRLADECFTIPARIGTAGVTIRIVAEELRAHGHPDRSQALAERVVAWYRQRPPPDTRRHRMNIGRSLMLAGREGEAMGIFRELAREFPDDLEVLGVWGSSSARAGDADEAARVDERLAEMNSSHLYGHHALWRARIQAQLGDHSEAVGLIRAALAEGAGFSIGWHRDPFFEPLWKVAEFRELTAPKG